MLDVQEKPALEFPDDPLKWDGWSKYRSDNPYERLCLDPATAPDEERIQLHCTALLHWWRKKLRLRTQPSNPMAQLLGRGLDEASACLVQARMQLLDPVRRREVDEGLAVQAQDDTLAAFSKYVAFAVAGKVLTADAEAILSDFGQSNGLTEEQARACIEEQLQRKGVKRVATAPAPLPEPTSPAKTRAQIEMEFHRILRLSNLDLADATALVRRIFVTIGENLGITLERAEHLLDDYLDFEEPVARPMQIRLPAVSRAANGTNGEPRRVSAPPPPAPPIVGKMAATRTPAIFTNPLGAPMLLIPPGEFVMGSNAPEAGQDEQPLTPVTMSEIYMSRFPVTNAQYEKFDPSHRHKRMNGAGPDHPVVYITSLDAVKFCEWLRRKDGKAYRLPTEAEWEYAARGIDGRTYPWGNESGRGFANFADSSTTFAWRDPLVHDGYPETSPVGAFPRGASYFGIEDMAGNVWEWCLDFYQPLPGTPKRNHRGPVSGIKRVYRGGSWKSRFSNLRATARSANAANYCCNDVGFRIACEIEMPNERPVYADPFAP
jgi:formylglycine-generating enzyme required for sulfatase activity